MPAGPKFGSAANSLRFSIADTADFLELFNGFSRERYFRKAGLTISETVEELTSYGIAKSTAGSGQNDFARTIESITFVQSEDVIMHESWNENEPNTDDATQGGALISVDALLILRLEERWTVNGFGTMPQHSGTDWKRGDDVDTALVVASACTLTGGTPVTITIPAESSGAQAAQVNSTNIDRENTAFGKWTLEFLRYSDQDTPAEADTNHLLADPVFANSELTTLFDPDEYYYKLTKTTTLNADTFAQVVYSVELHEKHA